jgi:hypothetical protein
MGCRLIIDDMRYAPSLFNYIKNWADEKHFAHKSSGQQSENPAKPFWVDDLDVNKKQKNGQLWMYIVIFGLALSLSCYLTISLRHDKFFGPYMQICIEHGVKDYQGTTNELKFHTFVRTVALRIGCLLNICEILKRFWHNGTDPHNFIFL